MDGRFEDSTLSGFTEALASKAPVPGGGGAAALSGAVGAALSSMTASLTIGKKKYADVQPDMEKLLEKAEELRLGLLDLISRDAEAFQPLAEAYGLPHGTPKEQERKEKVMEEALHKAAETPYQIMERTAEALVLAREAAQKGSKIAVSDAGCAAVILEGALKAASLNVFVNTKLMKDRAFAGELDRKTERLLSENVALAEDVYRLAEEKVHG